MKTKILLMVIGLLWVTHSLAQDTSRIVNDITKLNPVRVDKIIRPTHMNEITEAVRNHAGPVSIGGGRYSMGGQTATEGSLHIDMRSFDSVLSFSLSNKEITVQSGITWRKIQEYIDPYDLSLRIMQSYANFTVGGSLSVNVHGRYIGEGPLILSVKQIKIVLADGSVQTASPSENQRIFYAAIGGYGGIGIITEATLSLTDNCRVQRHDSVFSISGYSSYFMSSVRKDTTVIFHNADIYPEKYRTVRTVSYLKTENQVTIPHRLKPDSIDYRYLRAGMKVIAGFPGGKALRRYILDPIRFRDEPVEWRNFEASYDVKELEPASREKSTYVLQEYFVPVDSFNTFYPRLRSVLRKHKVNVINISIRHAKQDPGSLLAWARTEVFAFVIYYRQGTSEEDKRKVAIWTRELIDMALLSGGTYYLPYQIHASREQFLKAYPRAPEFFALKKELDPTCKFRNKLWDAYYQ